MTIAIIGSGLAGSAAAHGLKKAGKDSVIFEAAAHTGGHTHSEVLGDVTVDEGPHISFTKDDRVRALFEESAGEIEELTARITNYFEGKWVTHPAQVHLHGLDAELVTQCIVDFASERATEREIRNYADWLRGMYGLTFAETFPFRYTRKYWTVEPEELGVDWVGQRMYPPKLEEVVAGALSADNNGEFHYFKTYRYPRTGGYQSFMRLLAEDQQVQTNKEVNRVDAKAKTVSFTDGTTQQYTDLVSSMPLDKLVQALVDAPEEVREAGKALLCTSAVLVDISVGRDDLFDHDWFYVYDEDIAMARVHFPHHFSPMNAPNGVGAIQAEVYFSRHKPLMSSIEEVGRQAVDGLVRMGVLRSTSEVRTLHTRVLPYANIVFDHHRQAALDVIVPFVQSQGIHLAGRFGEWGYHWTDDATNSGWKAAAAIVGTTVDELLS